MSSRFPTGTSIVIRYLWLDRVFWAIPARVVADDGRRSAVWVAPGSRYRRPARLSMAEIAAGEWEPLPVRWTGNGTLMVWTDGDPYSVWLFWDDDARFDGWYLNLERPRRRTALGFDSRDHQLDVVIEANRSWRWKDEDDLADALAVGLLTGEEAREIRAAGEAFLADVDERLPTGYEAWRPDPAWADPELPASWAHVG